MKPSVHEPSRAVSLRAAGLFSLAVLFFAGVLSGCGGIAALDPDEFVQNVRPQDPKLSSVSDGEYQAEYRIAVPPGVAVLHRRAKVRVVVADGGFTEITILSPDRLKKSDDFDSLAERVVETDSLAVDTVSGATYSSLAVLKAIEKAATP